MEPKTQKAGEGVVRIPREFSKVEEQVVQRWFRGVMVLDLYRMRAGAGGGLFCVHRGSLANVPTGELAGRLQVLLASGRGTGPAATALNAELARRTRAALAGKPQGPHGPDAA